MYIKNSGYLIFFGLFSYIVYLNDFADERKDDDAMGGVGMELS